MRKQYGNKINHRKLIGSTIPTGPITDSPDRDRENLVPSWSSSFNESSILRSPPNSHSNILSILSEGSGNINRSRSMSANTDQYSEESNENQRNIYSSKRTRHQASNIPKVLEDANCDDIKFLQGELNKSSNSDTYGRISVIGPPNTNLESQERYAKLLKDIGFTQYVVGDENLFRLPSENVSLKCL